MKNQTIGIEIEMNHITRQKAARVIARTLPSSTLGDGATIQHIGGRTYDVWEITGVDGRKWKVMRDGSIEGPDLEKTEVVSPVLRWEDIPLVQDIVAAMLSSLSGPLSRPVFTDAPSCEWSGQIPPLWYRFLCTFVRLLAGKGKSPG